MSSYLCRVAEIIGGPSVLSQARRYFFSCTDDAVDRMTELFDFVWPAVSAFVFARSKACRYSTVTGNERQLALAAYFNSPQNIREEYRSINGLKRANLDKAFIQTDWPVQEQVFARLVLVNVFAIYEGWLEDLVDEFYTRPEDQRPWKKKFITASQFHFATSKHNDWTWAMNELHAKRSAALEACFGISLRGKRLYSSLKALNLLRCYRYFKELRNSIMHHNGKAGQTLIAATNDYNSFIAQTNNALGTNTAAPMGTKNAITLGSEIDLSLFGVVGFNDIVLRLMCTLDTEAGLTTFGENAIVRFLRSRVNHRSISGNIKSTARRMANEYGLVGLKEPEIFTQMLASHGISMP